MDKEVTRRLVKVFDIAMPLLSLGALFAYAIEAMDSYRIDFEDYAVFVFLPHTWWVGRYILTGQLFPGLLQNNTKPDHNTSAEVSKVPSTDLSEVKPSDQPSVWRYIGVWVLAGLITAIANIVLGAIFASELRHFSNPVNAYLFMLPAIAVLLTLGIWVGIYKQAKSLRISRVMPYIYLSVVLGILAEIGGASIDLSGYISDDQMTAYIVYVIILYLGFALGFRAAFRKTDRWD